MVAANDSAHPWFSENFKRQPVGSQPNNTEPKRSPALSEKPTAVRAGAAREDEAASESQVTGTNQALVSGSDRA